VPLQPGSDLLHYRLVEKIGEGGMGVVWRAADTDLDRDVAIKVLPDSLSGEAETLARFEREARLLASLSHPNIATVHGLHEDGGVRFLAMELVAGEDLAERLKRGPVPPAETYRIALQIARALEAAHESGVIHRDLKPANVRLTADGSVKVLDFGLAKAFDRSAPAGGIDSSLSPTLTSMGTIGGMILGTAGYMSPEQAAGQPVDKRCDIWAFGVVLYELLTSRRLFHGETVSHTLADVLRAEIDLGQLPASVPAELRRLVRRCLDRDAGRRLRDVGEARVLLEDLAAGRVPATDEARPVAIETAPPAPRLPWLVAAAAVLAALTGFALLATREPPPDPPVGRFSLNTLARSTVRGDGRLVAISPDGRRVVVGSSRAGDDLLYLRRLDSFEVETLTPSTGGTRLPTFSPDGTQLCFVNTKGVWRVNLTGGPPVRLGPPPPYPGAMTWAADGFIYLATNDSIWRLPESGGELETVPLSAPAPGMIVALDRLPKARSLLVSTQGEGAYRLSVLDLATGALTGLDIEGSDARYLPSGHLLYLSASQVMAVAFDLDRLRPVGAPNAVLDRVATDRGVMQLAVADTGTVVYLPARADDAVRLVLVDREGLDRPLLENPPRFAIPNDVRFSPDGTKLAVTDTLGPVWVIDRESETPTLLSEQGFYPVWSADSSTIYYGTTRGKSFDIYRRRIDLSAPEEKVLDLEDNLRTGDMAPSDALLFRQEIPDKGMDLMIWTDLDDPSTVAPLLAGPADELSPEVSPDGRWLAYVSDQSGRDEIFVTSFPEPGAQVQASIAGGTSPAWSPDSKELYYFSSSDFIAVRLETSPRLRVTGRETLFSGSYEQYRWQRQYDVDPRGEGFAMIQTSEGGEAEIIVNWFQELERLVPLAS